MPATTGAHPARTPPEERLLNLVVALMSTARGLTKEDILQSVSGYRQRSEAGASTDALEKMFERDKESLRGLGVPVQTIGDRLDPDDLREARYRIPVAEYALPDDVTFTPAELAVLTVAGGVWSRGSASADARTALRKIHARGMGVDEPLIGYSPHVTTPAPSFGTLQRAIDECRVVTFTYLKPEDAAARVRRVRPLALVDYESRWHVFGIDIDAEADRTFLLSRISGPVRVTRERFDPGLRDGAGERALHELRELSARQTAVIEVEPGSDASLRLRRRARPGVGIAVTVPYADLHVFADELASYGPEVRVRSPQTLRAAVVRRLTAVRRAHAEASR